MNASDESLDESSAEGETAVWPVFGDLMAGLLGAFVLMLMWLMSLHLELGMQLQSALQEREAEQQRRQVLEQVLAVPLAAGRVTLNNGRIGINGSVLFAPGSADLQDEGRQLLRSLSQPLATYLGTRREMLMVSGFTDDRSVREGRAPFADNLELSAQRAMTVTRALIDAGLPAESIFAAAFGQQQPVASNADAAGRALNRRVEMSPVPVSPSQRAPQR